MIVFFHNSSKMMDEAFVHFYVGKLYPTSATVDFSNSVAVFASVVSMTVRPNLAISGDFASSIDFIQRRANQFINNARIASLGDYGTLERN